MTFLTCRTIQNIPFSHPLSTLLDSGSATSWFNKSTLPNSIQPTMVVAIKGTTIAGEFNSNQLLTLSDVSLPELLDFVLPSLPTRLFTAPCHYDLILGHDILSQFKININFNNKLISGPDSHTVQLCQFPNAADLSATDVGVCLAMDHFETSIIDIMMTTNDNIDTTPLSDPPVTLPVDLNSSGPTTPSPLKKKQTYYQACMKHMTLNRLWKDVFTLVLTNNNS